MDFKAVLEIGKELLKNFSLNVHVAPNSEVTMKIDNDKINGSFELKKDSSGKTDMNLKLNNNGQSNESISIKESEIPRGTGSYTRNDR